MSYVRTNEVMSHMCKFLMHILWKCSTCRFPVVIFFEFRHRSRKCIPFFFFVFYITYFIDRMTFSRALKIHLFFIIFIIKMVLWCFFFFFAFSSPKKYVCYLMKLLLYYFNLCSYFSTPLKITVKILLLCRIKWNISEETFLTELTSSKFILNSIMPQLKRVMHRSKHCECLNDRKICRGRLLFQLTYNQHQNHKWHLSSNINFTSFNHCYRLFYAMSAK